MPPDVFGFFAIKNELSKAVVYLGMLMIADNINMLIIIKCNL